MGNSVDCTSLETPPGPRSIGIESDVVAWAVEGNTDRTEGRGRQYVAALCRTESTALRLARGSYVQGTDAPVRRVVLHRTPDGGWIVPRDCILLTEPTRDDVAAEEALAARRVALEKARAAGLTDEDIEALRALS